MIIGAKELYHSYEFNEKMNTRMTLFTFLDGKLYWEDVVTINFKKGDQCNLWTGKDEHMKAFWLEYLGKLVEHPDFPRKLQFWVRLFPDIIDMKPYFGFRFDLKYPQFWWDSYKY